MNWEVYIIEARNGSLYTGISTDPERRFQEHREGKTGARFFRTAAPERILWREKQPDRPAALKREIEIKRMSHQEKLLLARGENQDDG